MTSTAASSGSARVFQEIDLVVDEERMLEWAITCGETDPRFIDPDAPRLPGVDRRSRRTSTRPACCPTTSRRSARVGASTAASRSSGTARCAPATGSTPTVEIADIYAKTGRSGTMVFIVNRMTFPDAERRAGRHRRLADDQAGLMTMRIDDVELGDELPEERPDVSLETVQRFVKAAADGLPPLHRPRARPAPRACPGAVIPGIMSQGQLAAMIHRWAPGCDDPRARHHLPHADGRRHARGVPRRGDRTSRTTARSRST